MNFNKYIPVILILNLCVQHSSFALETELPKETQPSKESQKEVSLTPSDLLFEVTKRNSTILSNELQWQMAEQIEKSKEAIFEPTFYAGYTRSEINVPNTTQQEQYRLQLPNYREKTNNYEAGIKGLLPTGGTYKLGLNSIDRQSSLIAAQKPYSTEYDNTLTITLVQPLLRDMGMDVTMTQANIAKANQEIAFYTYRQKIIETAGIAAQAYWRLYGLQQMYKGWQESVKIAEDLVSISKSQAENGRIAPTEVLVAESGVALRKTKMTEAKSDIQDAQTNLFNLLSISVSANPQLNFKLTPHPESIENVEVPKFEENLKTALELWPPYLISQKKIEISELQVNYADNQTLPRLDLIAGNPHNSLTANRFQSLGQTFSGNHVSWNAGVQLEMPILGNKKAEAELQVAQLAARQARLEAEPIKRELSNNLFAKITRLQNAKSSLSLNKKNYHMAEELLEAELQRLEMGKSSNYDVLKREEDTINRRRDYLSSLIELKVAETLVDIANGSLFDKYNIRISRSEGDVTVAKDSLEGSRIQVKD